MIAKLVVWGQDRNQALNSLISRLSEYHVSCNSFLVLKMVDDSSHQISGLETNVNFLIDLARHESFQKADVHTGFIQQHFDTLFPVKVISDDMLLQGAVSLIVNENNAALTNALRAGRLNDPFAMNLGFRVNSSSVRTVVFKTENKEEKVFVTQVEDGFRAKVNDGEWRNVQVKTVEDEGRFSLKINVDGSVFNFSAVITPEAVTIFNEVSSWTIQQDILMAS